MSGAKVAGKSSGPLFGALSGVGRDAIWPTGSKSEKFSDIVSPSVFQCDGQRPKCSSCIEQSLDCIYASNAGSKDALVPKM